MGTVMELLGTGSDGDAALVVPDGPTLTYGMLRQHVERTAGTIAALGLARGDRIASVLPHGAEAVIAFLAATVRTAAAPLNPGFTDEELQYFLRETRARALVMGPGGTRHAARHKLGGLPVIELALRADGGLGIEIASTARSSGADAAARGDAPPRADDVALVLHSSGTTGRPKRVALTHRNLVASATRVAETYALRSADRSLALMPLFHVHGLVASVLATLGSGGTLVVPPRSDPASFRRLLSAHRVTWYTAVPAIHQLVLGRGTAAVPGGLRFARSASAKLPLEMLTRLEARLAAPVVEAYGMTEAAHQIASNPLDPGRRVPGSVGMPTGVDLRIADENGRSLPVGERGEVVIRGPNVIERYDDDPDADEGSFFPDGWFRTGDLGVLDDDGYLTLVARIGEIINRGGEKIIPGEIDEVLLRHPAVAEAACFGLPHHILGEEVAAAVVLREPVTDGDLRRHCRRHIAAFKTPQRIHVVEEIPRTALGKVSRTQLASTFGASLKIVIVGAGAIGGFLGARLARAGEDVTLVARGAHLAAMRERGIRVRDAEGEFVARPACSEDLGSAVRDAEVVFLTLKANAVAGIAGELAAALRPDAAVVTAQNGIPWWYFERHGGPLEGTRLRSLDPEGAIAGTLDATRLIGCVVYPAAEVVEPGVIFHVEGTRFPIGELDGSRTDRCAAISAALVRADLKAPVRPRIRDDIWLKLLGNAALNPLSGLTGAMLHEIGADPAARAAAKALMEECVAVALRLNVKLELSVDQRLDAALRIPDHKTSMLVDLEHGREPELEPIVGAVIEIARLVNVETPRLELAYACVKLLDRTRRPPTAPGPAATAPG